MNRIQAIGLLFCVGALIGEVVHIGHALDQILAAK